MGMTEKQGGTDVRANTTRAERGRRRRSTRITGHKWFFSAPMSDAFLVLAQTKTGLTCFLMPRFLPDGTQNAIRIERLKDKLGNRSNASAEVEFHGATAWRVGDEGRGIPTILDMVTLTRLDCAVASTGLMRVGLAEAVHHVRYRTAFGKPLIDQPLMTAGACRHGARPRRRRWRSRFRLAEAYDMAEEQPAEAAYRAADDAGGQILGVQERAGASSPRRWSAWAATAMSRTARCRGSIARRRSTPSGKAPATSWRSTSCAR